MRSLHGNTLQRPQTWPLPTAAGSARRRSDLCSRTRCVALASLTRPNDSPEAQAKSYAEARKEMDRLRSEMEAQGKQFSEAVQELTAENQAPALDLNYQRDKKEGK